jgi:hypothetical protein
MPNVTLAIGVKETESTFETRIVNAAKLLVGKYNVLEHNAYTKLRHGQLNRVFELAGMLCQPHLEPIPIKRKATATSLASALQKTDQKWRCTKVLFHSGDQTSAQKLALAKALKPSRKFSLGSSGLSLSKKATTAKVKTSTGGGGGGHPQPLRPLVVPTKL